MDESKLVLPRPVPPPPLTFADPKSVRAALELLKNAKNPLVIVGKVPIGLYSCPIASCIRHSQSSLFSATRAPPTLVLRLKPLILCTFKPTVCVVVTLIFSPQLTGQQRNDRSSVPSHADGQGCAIR